MSNFAVTINSVRIEEHPNADALQIARIGDYASIVRRNQFANGDLVAYIPEGAILPVDLIAELGLTGKLAGPDANRVKAVKLRGVLSQGLCLAAREGWRLGDDVTSLLNITKYDPPVPAGFQGELQNVGSGRVIKYDIENFKRFPDVFEAGEMVVMTEKCHGTFALFGVLGTDNRMVGATIPEERLIISSKGVAGRGLAFKPASEANANNLYVRTALQLNLLSAVEKAFGLERDVYIMGEIFGPGVQDLAYGLSKPQFRIFDIYVGTPGAGHFLNDSELDVACNNLGINRVPVLYRGPFSREVMDTYTNGKETVSGKGMHTREGVVIRSAVERQLYSHDLPCWGRVQLKSVSEDYLLRRGNTTEFQ